MFQRLVAVRTESDASEPGAVGALMGEGGQGGGLGGRGGVGGRLMRPSPHLLSLPPA